jgi:hypothetical protein
MVGQLEATTTKYHDKELKDCTSFRSYYFTKLMKNTRETLDGRSYTWPVKIARQDIQWLGEMEKQDREHLEKISQAEEGYKFSSISAVLSEQELKKNSGKSRILPLLSRTLSMLKSDVGKSFSTALWTGDADKQPRGIVGEDRGWVDVHDVTANLAGTVAGIVRGTDDVATGELWDSWWRPYVASGATLTQAMMNLAIMGCSWDNNSPDTMISGKAVWNFGYAIATGYQKEEHRDAAKLGFKSMTFNGLPWVWDDDAGAASSDSLFFFRMADHALHFLKGSRMHRTKWFKPENQRAIVCDIINDCLFVVEAPRNQAALKSVSAPA